MVVQIVFLNTTNLICRSTDISKCFRGSLRFRELTVFNNMLLIVVRQEVSNFDSSVVVHELEVAINRALYGCLYSLGSQ